MSIEYKQVPYFVKSIDVEKRVVTGIFAVHGNRDEGGDISENGSFGKCLSEGRNRVRFLWNHDSWQPPIASILDIREVGRDGLPSRVLEYAPEATGGVEVTRKYYEEVALSDWVFTAIQEGDIDEMSYAYDLHRFEIEVDEETERRTRIMKEVELFDISDVNWGMNPATAGVKGLPVTGMTFTQHSKHVVATLETFVARTKDRKAFREWEERTLSEKARERLGEIEAVVRSILDETQPKADADTVQDVISEYLRIESKLGGDAQLVDSYSIKEE